MKCIFCGTYDVDIKGQNKWYCPKCDRDFDEDDLLNNKEIHDIKKALYDAWETPPNVKAAQALRKLGYSSEDLWRFCKTSTASLIDDHWKNNTLNTLRNMERE